MVKKSKKYTREYRYPLVMPYGYKKMLWELSEKENETLNDMIVAGVEMLLKKKFKDFSPESNGH